MNLLDLGLIVVLALAAWRGYLRGLFQEISTIIGLILGLVVAAHYYLRLAKLISPHIADPTYNRLLSFFLLFILVYWLIRLVGLILRRFSNLLFLGPVDRILGCLFAVAKMAVILGFLLTALALFIPPDSKLLREAKTVPYLKGAYQQLLLLLPVDFKNQVKEKVLRFQKEWSDRSPQPEKGEAI